MRIYIIRFKWFMWNFLYDFDENYIRKLQFVCNLPFHIWYHFSIGFKLADRFFDLSNEEMEYLDAMDGFE